jgi:hypothetical protein
MSKTSILLHLSDQYRISSHHPCDFELFENLYNKKLINPFLAKEGKNRGI